MSATTYDTDDLRAVLNASADTTGDVADFRRRLEQRLAAEAPATAEVVADEPTVVPLHTPAGTRRTSRRWQLLTGAALAACVAAIAVVVALLPGATHRTPPAMPTPDPHVQVPKALRGSFYPGSIPLRNFAGVGTTTIGLGATPPVPNHTYWIYGTCSHGSIVISAAAGTRCDSSGFGFGLSGGHRSTRVEVGRGVTWRLLLVLEPDSDSNANVIGVGPAPFRPTNALRELRRDAVWRSSGSGDATVTIPAIAEQPHRVLNVQLICSGSGVALSSADGQVPNDYTHTCWRGWIYQWQHARLHTPTSLVVHASGTTRWTVAIVQF
jgi:hypothetical protein